MFWSKIWLVLWILLVLLVSTSQSGIETPATTLSDIIATATADCAEKNAKRALRGVHCRDGNIVKLFVYADVTGGLGIISGVEGGGRGV